MLLQTRALWMCPDFDWSAGFTLFSPLPSSTIASGVYLFSVHKRQGGGGEPAGDLKPGESGAIKGPQNAEARKSTLRMTAGPQTSVIAACEQCELQGNHLCLQADR